MRLAFAWLALFAALYGLFGYVAKRQSGVCWLGFTGCPVILDSGSGTVKVIGAIPMGGEGQILVADPKTGTPQWVHPPRSGKVK